MSRTHHGPFVGTFTAAIAVGALVGGFLVDGLGIVAMLWITAGLASISVLIAATGPGPAHSQTAGFERSDGSTRNRA